MTAKIAGVLPVLGFSPLGLPLPAEIHAVEPGALLLDYSLQQFQCAGIKKVYIPIGIQWISIFARALGYERRGIALEYVPIEPDQPQGYWNYALRGCRKAGYTGEFTSFAILNPTIRIETPEWLDWVIRNFEPPYGFSIPGTAYLTDDAVSAAFKIRTEPDALGTVLGSRVLGDGPEYLDLSNWEAIHTFIKGEF